MIYESTHARAALAAVLLSLSSLAGAESQPSGTPDSFGSAADARREITALAANPRVQDAMAHIVAIESLLHRNHIELKSRRRLSVKRSAAGGTRSCCAKPG